MVYMTLAQRDRIRSILTAILLLTVGLTLLFRLRLAPMAEQLIVTQVDNQASDAINAAIDEQIAAGEIDYSRMITVEKDAQGNVTALRTNIAEINRLKTSVLQRVDAKLQNLSMEELGVPIGSIVLPELLFDLIQETVHLFGAIAAEIFFKLNVAHVLRGQHSSFLPNSFNIEKTR